MSRKHCIVLQSLVYPATLKMNLAILIAVAALATSSAADKCSGYYRVPNNAGQVLIDNIESPYQLALDRNTNTLFFSYTTSNVDDAFQSMYLNLKDNTSGNIPGIISGFAHAYDDQHQIVYIGGRDGLYKFDYNSKKAVNLNITDSNIWQIFYKNGLYFTTYPEEKAFIYKNGLLERVAELKNNKAMLIAVDKDKSMFFAHDGELKRVYNGQFIVLGDYSVNGFNTDANDNLYFSTPNAIYKVSGNLVKKVASFLNIYGFAIEEDDQLIYAADKSLVRVTLTPDMCGYDKEIENETFNNI